jgi:hypothetical protein
VGIITERVSAADDREAVPVKPAPDAPAPDQAALPKAALHTVAQSAGGGVILRRRSALQTRRSVLYLHCEQETFVAEDLVTWYTERGFHFYVADLRPQDWAGRQRGPGRGECFDRLDSACRHLRDAEGIDMIIVAAHGADALTAALWCDARRDAGLADALILSSPVFGRRLRRGLDIACPVLLMFRAGDPGTSGGTAGRLPSRKRRRNETAAVRLGPHVTWLTLDEGLDGQAPGAGPDRRRFFDELGRWLGAYMYGKVRDQLL